MREVYYIKDGKIVSTMINCGTDVLRYHVRKKTLPVAVTSATTDDMQYKTEEIEIREVRIDKHAFYVAAKDGAEWYEIVSKLAVDVGEYSEAIRAGIQAISYKGQEAKYIILSTTALDALLAKDTSHLYQPACTNECEVDTYLQVPVAVVNSSEIIVEVV